MEKRQFEELIDCHGRALRWLLTWCVSPRTNGPLLGRLRRQFGKSVPMTLTMSGGCAFGGGSLNGKFNIDAADGSYEASGNGMLGILGIKPSEWAVGTMLTREFAPAKDTNGWLTSLKSGNKGLANTGWSSPESPEATTIAISNS